MVQATWEIRVIGLQKLRCLPALFGLGVAFCPCLVSSTAVAQRGPASPTSVTDAYGNARPFYQARRRVGVFQNQAQRDALRGYQLLGRRLHRRGGLTPFVLPGDALGRMRARPRTVAPGLFGTAGSLPWHRGSFNRYGGFGPRAGSGEAAGLHTALSRRQALIAATSLNAPVHRASLRSGASVGLPSTVGQVPFVPAEESNAGAPAVMLGQRLRADADVVHKHMQADAWSWFREAEYRRAARAFETAVMLQPLDAESRIGELFCHLSLGATRTAVAVLGELTRRERNPFLYDLRLADAYGDASEARRVRVESQLRASIAGDNADLRALHALALWFLGEQDEAIAAASSLVRDLPGAGYVDWPGMMHAARPAQVLEPGQPNP